MSLEGLQAVASIGSSAASVGRTVAGVTQGAAPFIHGGLGAAGSIVQGRGAQQTAEFNAKISELESGLALQSAARSDLNATIARNAAQIEAGRYIEAGRRIQGTQAAQAAHAGLVVTEGSPLLAQLETLKRSEEDAVIARWKGDVTATGFEAEAAQKRIQAEAMLARAKMLRIQGRQTFLSGLLGAGKAGIEGLTLYEKIKADQPKMPGASGWTPSELMTLQTDTGFGPIG